MSSDPFTEWQSCAHLRQADMDALRAAGVPTLALAHGFDGTGLGLVRARVVVHPNGRRFEFTQYSRGAFLNVAAYVVPALDRELAISDLVAFSCSNAPFVSAWLGRVGMLGEEQLDDARLAQPLRVWSSTLDWLRADREGVVVVDPVRAAPMLRDAGPLVVGSSIERNRLADVMAVRLPRIEIEAPERRAAAE